MQLTANFSISEFVYSDTAKRFKIDNRPSVQVVENLRQLCIHVMQPLRDYMKKPVKITSGFRCAVLNKKVGGVSNSQHQMGQACDFVMSSTDDLKKAYEYIKNNLIYDQVLYEYDKNGNKWVHVSYRNDNKNRRKYFDNYKA